MTTKQLKNPGQQRSSEQQFVIAQKQFDGMVLGLPLTEIADNNVYKHIDIIGYGRWSEARPGTRVYSKARLPGYTFTPVPATDRLLVQHRYLTGDRVKVWSRGTMCSPLQENTYYYVIYIDDANIQLATTYNNAIAGTQINITDVGTGLQFIRYAANLGSALDHKKENRILKQYARFVYVAEKPMESWEQVINMESVEPTGIGRMVESGSNAILAAGSIFRIVLDGDFYYMYRINAPVPTVIITDVNETGALPYGYRYYYSHARIEGTGNRNRVSADSVLVMETGTCNNPNQEKQFGEVFYANAVGDDLTQDHIIGILTLPLTAQASTHFPLYRTKNIGETTGGEGNDKSYYVWDEDIPVAKAFSITVAGNVATIVAGQNEFVRGDVGCILRSDAAGTRTGTIASWINGNSVNLVAGHTLNAIDDVAIGEGRVMTCSQVGYLINRTAGDVFTIADEGRTFYWGDGGFSVIRRFEDANNVEAAINEAHVIQAGTIQLNAGFAFRRYWNDTILDDGDKVGEIGLQERTLSQRDLYIPQFNYRPVPNSDIVITDSGFTIFANRDVEEYTYSHIGAKPYVEGQYRLDQQRGELPVSIMDLRVMPANAIFLCHNKTYNLSLNVPTPNVGNDSIGEFIPKLLEPSEVDGEIGVIHWQTIAWVNASVFIALTNEPAIRLFDGQNWSKVNLALEPTGDAAVMEELNKIDAFYTIIGWYSMEGGYKLAFSKWVDA
jgi:hypothetical protein